MVLDRNAFVCWDFHCQKQKKTNSCNSVPYIGTYRFFPLDCNSTPLGTVPGMVAKMQRKKAVSVRIAVLKKKSNAE